MATVYDGIGAEMAVWIEQQPLFFVATAPLAADGLVNLSPKGTVGTFRVVDEHTFAYIDSRSSSAPGHRGQARRAEGRRRTAPSGSGVETVAHLQENGRVCVMFCSFDRRPTIVRLHGTGRAVLVGDPAFAASLDGLPGLDTPPTTAQSRDPRAPAGAAHRSGDAASPASV